MRHLEAADFAGRVTFFSGPGRGTGKTSLLLAALAMLRVEGEKAGIVGIGFEGEAKGLGQPGRRATRLRVAAGELFASASSWLGSSGSSPEILGTLPGSGAFGTLALARATREGEIVLVGPESNEATAETIVLMRSEGASSVLVDGAFGRLTQVSAIEGARFFSSQLVDAANLAASLSGMRRLFKLAALPAYGAETEVEEAVFEVEGPLTSSIAATLPDRPVLLVVDDLTKVFLEEAALRGLLARHGLAVRRRIGFGGFVVGRRGLSWSDFESALGGDVPEELIFASPYEDTYPHEDTHPNEDRHDERAA